MEKSTNLSIDGFNGNSLTIYDSDISYYGGSQHWFPKITHRLSGCAPVAAANITAYLSQTFPEKYFPLYPYAGILTKDNFVKHMVEIRKHVIPGVFGLTSVKQFSDNLLAFTYQRGVSLVPYILDNNDASIGEAINFISQALSQRLPVAILVLKHPAKELKDYAWHWMTITGLKLDPTDNSYSISVTTYGECRQINLNLLWNHRRPQDFIRLAYFT
ncbi:MAG: hypothetical protein APF84_16705 [Gracilibacter sp. BRH_c7a]|nr:MAG: hypothetical protein APF84_16705 [Gracilibacter sp. BRH_c7a]